MIFYPLEETFFHLYVLREASQEIDGIGEKAESAHPFSYDKNLPPRLSRCFGSHQAGEPHPYNNKIEVHESLKGFQDSRVPGVKYFVLESSNPRPLGPYG